MCRQGGYEKSAPFVIDEGADLCLKLSRQTDLSKVGERMKLWRGRRLSYRQKRQG